MKNRIVGLLAMLGILGLLGGVGALAQQDSGSSQATGTAAPDQPQPDQSAPDQSAPDTQAPPDDTSAPLPPAVAKPKPAQSATAPNAGAAPGASGADQTTMPPDQTAAAPPVPTGPPPTPPNAVLEMMALDKITGKPTQITAPLNRPVEFATLTITARYCYSTPPSETPETTAFVQIDDRRPDKPERRVFSGWMYASSPSLNGMDHPLYDVWVISCRTSAPGQETVAHLSSHAPAKVSSPDVTDSEGLTALPEGSGQ